MKGLTGKVAVVAGGGQGIGAATAHRLAGEGAVVVVADRSLPRARDTAAAIEESGSKAVAVEFDLGDAESIEALFAFVGAEFGGLDLLHNVAASLGANSLYSQDADVVDIDPAVWSETLQINLTGYFLTTKAAVPSMLERGGGAIVNMSSVASVTGATEVAYSVSKSAVEALTRHTARRWAPHGIRANCVAPGMVATPTGLALTEERASDPVRAAAGLNPMNRLADPEEIAAIVTFLLSEECNFLTGQVLSVNGGSYLATH
ncbi:glucose 1-dehydrogenase [Pseudonocardia ailaonensis]|uniref:Glucose 1-dehydrogenase n=1 Tax=Pseudonocardia ailaonensis TaxID=367279 RepID=A0ABN2MYY6_9PSEU